MSSEIVQCQVLHVNTQTVWEFSHQVVLGSEEWQQFQDGSPADSGGVFVRDYIAPIEDNTDA